MKHRIRRLLAAVLSLGLLFSAACAAAPSLTGSWQAEKFLSLPIRGKLSVDIGSLVPFGEDRCAQLNALLSHVTLDVHAQPAGSGVWEKLGVLVEGVQAAWLNRRTDADGTVRLVCSADPDTTYVTKDPSGLAALLGTANPSDDLVPDEAAAALERSAWLDEAAARMPGLTEALAPWSKTAKVSTDIRDIGTARRRVTAVVPGEDAARLPELLRGVFGDLVPAGLTFSGRQNVQLYFNENDELVKLTWDGRAAWAEDDLRKVNLDWRFHRTDRRSVDGITLKSPAVSGTNRDNFTLTRQLTADADGAVKLTFKLTDDFVRGGKKTVWKAAAELNSAAEQAVCRVGGSMTLSCTRSDESRSWRYEPELTLDASSSLSMEGTVGIVYTEGKAELLRASLNLSLVNTDAFDWALTGQSVDLDANSDASVQRIRETLVQGLAAQVAAPLVLLPDEDVLFLSEGIDPAVWQQIREAAASQQQSIPLP